MSCTKGEEELRGILHKLVDEIADIKSRNAQPDFNKSIDMKCAYDEAVTEIHKYSPFNDSPEFHKSIAGHKEGEKREVEAGLALHCHYDRLYEFVYDYQERVDYINTYKPEAERELRLRLFKMVDESLVPGRESEAWVAYDEARAAYDEARAAYVKAWVAYDEARAAYDEARAAFDEAWAAYVKARAAYAEARAAYDEAWAAYDEAWVAYDEARAAYDEARAAYDEAWAAYVKAWNDYIEKYSGELAELHRQLCPDCPWDGKTIFTKEGK